MPKRKKEQSSSSEEEQEQYVVEVITKARVDEDRKWEYYVKWAGYDSDNNTWEPEENVKGCKRLLAGFWQDVGLDDEDYLVGHTVYATPTWIAKEKAFFANTFGRTTQVPSDAGESSDDGPIPKLEPLPRKKSTTKVTLSLVNTARKPMVAKIRRPRSHTPHSPPVKKTNTKTKNENTKQRAPRESRGDDAPSDSSSSSDVPLTAIQKRKKHRVVSREPSEESTTKPPKKKARTVGVSKKGKEKAIPSSEHEDSDHAGSLFSGSDGRSSPDVSLATKDPPRAERDSIAGDSNPWRANPIPLVTPRAPTKGNSGPSGIPTKMRLAQTAQSIVPAAKPTLTLQRPNLSKLSFKKNPTNTGSKPNTPVQEAHTFQSISNKPMAASPVTMESPTPFAEPLAQQPAAKASVPLPRRTAPPPPPANPITEVDQFLSTVMPPELAAPMDETIVDTQPRQPTTSSVTKPAPNIGRIPRKWKWTGEAFIEVDEGKAHRLCNISLYDMTEALPTGLRFSVCLIAADSIRLGKLHVVPELYMILRSTIQVQQFVKVGPSDDMDAEAVNALAGHLKATRSFTYARLSVDGVEAALMLVFPPSINELCRLLRVPEALLEASTAPMIAALVPWELSRQEYDDARWFQTRSEENPRVSFDSAVAALANERFATNSAFQRALRILNVPMPLYKYLTITSRTYCLWYAGADGKAGEIAGMETTALRTVLMTLKAKDMGYKSDVRIIFVHVGALKTFFKLPVLAERRVKQPEIRFYTYGTHESVAPERWGIREIFPIGGIVTFTPAAILGNVVEALELIKKIDEHPLWACYVLPSVVAMLAKLTCQDENPLALLDRGDFLFSELLEMVADGRLALLRAPPVSRAPRGADDPAAAWVSWQTAVLRLDARGVLKEAIELAAEQYRENTAPHALPEMIQKEIVRDMIGMQMQPAIMEGYRRFVVIKSRSDRYLSEDRDGIECTTVSEFGFKDDWFKN